MTFLQASKHAEKNKDHLIHINFFECDWLPSWTESSNRAGVIVHRIVSAIPATDTSSHSLLSLSPETVRRCRRKHCCQMAFVKRFNNRCSTCRLLVQCRMALQRKNKFSMPSRLHLFMAISMTALQYEALEPCVDSMPGPCIASVVGRTEADPTGCNFKC